MKHNFCITLERLRPPYIQNIEFFGSYYQASRVFDSLSYALCLSEYESMHLFCGEDVLKSIRFNRSNITKSEA